MSALKYRELKKKVNALNMPDILKALSKRREISLRTMSMLLGMNENFASVKRQNREYNISQLLAFSHYLDTNLFEVCATLLPENLRPTRREKELLQQVDDLQKRILEVEKEKELLKEILLRK